MTAAPPHQQQTAVVATIAAHHALCGTAGFARKIVDLLVAEPVLLDLSNDEHTPTITLIAHPYEKALP